MDESAQLDREESEEKSDQVDNKTSEGAKQADVSTNDQEVKEPETEIKEEKSVQEKKSSDETVKTKKILTPTLGEIYIAQQQFEKALDIFQQLSEMHPAEKKYKERIEFIKERMKDMDI